MSSFVIADAYYITGVGTVLVGMVKIGILKPGMKARVNGKQIEIKSIEKNHQQIFEARMGENVGIRIKQLEFNQGFFGKLLSSEKGLHNLFRGYKGRQIDFN